MKLKVRFKKWEQKNWVNAHQKYAIIGFDRHLPYDVAVDVAAVLFFVMLLCWLFENQRDMKMKLNISREWTKHKNDGNAHRK